MALNGVHGGLCEEDDAGNALFPGHLVFNNRVDDRGSLINIYLYILFIYNTYL